jgi:RNA polymerase primary sigma factor
VRLPLNRVGSLNKIGKAFSQLEQQHERDPSVYELAEMLQISADEVENTMSISGRHISMDAPFVQGEENTLLDVLINDDAPKSDSILMQESLASEIERSLNTLTERQRQVIQLYFGIGTSHARSLEDIGTQFELTRERVRQIKDKALKRLRHTSRSKLLKNYLG